MTDYDAEKQKLAAIQSLQAKQKRLWDFVVSGRSSPNAPNYFAPAKSVSFEMIKESRKKLFNDYYDNIKSGRFNVAYYKQFIANNPNSDIATAFVYVKLEQWIERLQAGEDVRTILYEVVSEQ